MVKKKNAFTLIELIAVLVIMAILALIVTPLVMNIIRKARVAADKRSIDAYGRSIEYAIAGYLLDNGKFPTDVSQLTIEYSGNQVVCSTTQLNSDSSVYLTGCTVGGRTVDYAYGKYEAPTYTAYTVGNQVTYNNVNYYVIKDSGVKESTVTLLKAEPLTVEEVNKYGIGHVNRYTSDSVGTVYDVNGYGGMAYYTTSGCGYMGSNGTALVKTGCTTDYDESEVKYVVDGWKKAKAPSAIEARLITNQEIEDNIEIEEYDPCGGCGMKGNRVVSNWMYDSNYWYWTMSALNDSSSEVWNVDDDGGLSGSDVYYYNGVVRPVVVVSKYVLSNQ